MATGTEGEEAGQRCTVHASKRPFLPSSTLPHLPILALFIIVIFTSCSSYLFTCANAQSNPSYPVSGAGYGASQLDYDNAYKNERRYQLPFYEDVSEKKAQQCYDIKGVAKRCEPGLVNAAYERRVEVTNECGVRRKTRFCIQTGSIGKKECDDCDARQERHRHPARFLTDHNDNNTETWWQSETMFDGVQSHHNATIKQVNLTLYLGRSFLFILFVFILF